MTTIKMTDLLPLMSRVMPAREVLHHITCEGQTWVRFCPLEEGYVDDDGNPIEGLEMASFIPTGYEGYEEGMTDVRKRIRRLCVFYWGCGGDETFNNYLEAVTRLQELGFRLIQK